MKRRDFILNCTAITAGQGVRRAGSRRDPFMRAKASAPTGADIVRITENLYWIRDTCSVYVIRQGNAGLMLDCGTDTTSLPLDRLGIAKIDQIFLTHFHRDQCSASGAWSQRGARIVVPFAERRFLEESDLLRASYDIFDSYVSYYPYFGPLANLRSPAYAMDYESLDWREIRFKVIPLPGHTFGAVGYLFDLDGRKILACGDLMSQPGKLTNYHSMQWSYMGFEGHANQLESLKVVDGLGVDLILPGHGRPFDYAAPAVEDLRRRLERIYELFNGQPFAYYRPQFRKVTEHVFEVRNSAANSYIIRDDEGRAVMIDCGYTSASPIHGNPHRYIDHLTPWLESEAKVRQVEWYVPSHYHDDHLAGYPALRARYGTRVFCSPEMKDILEHPERYNMPCLLPQGLKVDRVVARGESFEWRGLRFFVEQHPGQTIYHHLIWFSADGKKFLSIGDNISGRSFREARDYIYSFIPKNRTPVARYPDLPRQILDHAPDILLTGHGGAVVFERSKVEKWQAWVHEWQRIWKEVLDQDPCDMGMDPQWVEFYPFRVRVAPGETVRFEIRITNHAVQKKPCGLTFRSVPGVHLTPRTADLEVPGGEVGRVVVEAKFPDRFETHSLSVLADVTWDGRRMGEIAEAVAFW